MLRILKKIPAGIMIIPLLLGAIINTCCPQVLLIGSYTTATFSNAGAATALGIQLVCLGSRLKFKELPSVGKRGGIILLSKLLVGLLTVWIIGLGMGLKGIWGISLLAIVCAISNTNGSIYLSLMALYGEEKDAAAVPIITINNGPFFALLILGISGLAELSWVAVLAALLPIVVGMVLGNSSEEIRKFLDVGVVLLLPFIGFSLGAGINLKSIVKGGTSGIILALIVLLFGTGITMLADKWIARRPGYAGLAASATGANAVAVPSIIATIDPSWQMYVESATVQVAAAAVITAFIIPLATKLYVKRSLL